jgi:cell division protein FtsQ
VFFGLAVAALAGGVAWALLGSSFFVVRVVRVTGSGPVPLAAVRAAAHVALGTPLVRVDTAAVARRVEQITAVQSAQVTRSWPEAIVIAVVLRTAVLAVRAGGGYDRVDRFGVVLGWARGRPVGLPLLASPAPPAAALRGNWAVQAAGTVVASLPAWLRLRVSAVRVTGPSAVTLTLTGAVTVTWGAASRAAAKARELAVLLRTGARYYDVSDPVTVVTGQSPPPEAAASMQTPNGLAQPQRHRPAHAGHQRRHAAQRRRG